jgi:SAM-dependent methyltransferase
VINDSFPPRSAFCYTAGMSTEKNLIRDAYNSAAEPYREKYDNQRVRSTEVDCVLKYVSADAPKVLEIGCAYGREAEYILTQTPYYTGIDISEKFITIARRDIEGGVFQCADVHKHVFPEGLDAVFAFASLLHSSKEELQKVLKNVHSSLNTDGVVFLSLKRKAQYGSGMVTDEYTTRKFYYYNRKTILELCNGLYSEVFYDEQIFREPWFTMILKKKT